MSVAELEFSVVLDLVQEDNLAVGQKTGVHSGDTGTSLLHESSGLRGRGRRAGLGSRNHRTFRARARLASLATVRCGVTTVAVHGAAGTLSPVPADRVAKGGATAAVDGDLASGLSSGRGRGLTKDGLARSGDGWGSGSRIGLNRSV